LVPSSHGGLSRGATGGAFQNWAEQNCSLKLPQAGPDFLSRRYLPLLMPACTYRLAVETHCNRKVP